MKKEGWLLAIFIFTGTVLYAGMNYWQNLSASLAGEYKLSGELIVDGVEYDFSDERTLTINNARDIIGTAVADSGDKIYFNTEGAGVKVDQLGYLYGQLYGDKIGLTDMNVGRTGVVRIISGYLTGTKKTTNGQTITFNAVTGWQPEELVTIDAPTVLTMEVGQKQQIESAIQSVSGDTLYDVQVSYKSNIEAVVVDEYGYVDVLMAGQYPDAITMSVGSRQQNVSIQATVVNDVTTVVPDIVEAGAGVIEVGATFEDDVVNITDIKLKKGVDEEINCSSISKPTPDSVRASCDFGTDTQKNLGYWNLSITFLDEGERVYPSKIFVVSPESLNMTVTNKVYSGSTLLDGGTIKQGDTVKYNVSLDWPSYVRNKGYQLVTGPTSIVTVNYKGEGNAQSCKTPEPKDKIVQTILKTPDSYKSQIDNDLVNLSGSTDLSEILVVTYNDDKPEGCDLITEIVVEMRLSVGAQVLRLSGRKEIRNPVKQHKKVGVEGNLLVQSGDIQINRLDPDQSLYTFTAGGQVKTDGGSQTLKGEISNYDLTLASMFEQVITGMRDKMNKLVIERGDSADLTSLNGSDALVNSFTSEQKALMPEGRIIYNDYSGIGPLAIGAPTNINVCGPTTLVVEGRDVYINSDIVMTPAGGDCVERGNFGLIVFDGDIYFAGNVENVEGFFLTTGTMYTGKSSNSFTLKGVAIAHDYSLQRY